MQNKQWIFSLAFLILLTLACSVQKPDEGSISATLTPLSASVERTATARASEKGGPQEQLATAVVKATQRSEEISVTQTARASKSDVGKMATATIAAPVVAELPRYGVDPAKGQVAWLHNPVTIDLTGYKSYGVANDYSQVTAKDFVLASDITWNTDYGSSGCGFVFRSDGNQQQPSQYQVLITRFANGYMAFLATVKGDLANMHTYYPVQVDTSFSWLNEKTNRLAVVARGNLIDLYTNGILQGTIDTTLPPPTNNPMPPRPELPAVADEKIIEEYENQVNQYDDIANTINSQLSVSRVNYENTKAIYTDGFVSFIGVSESGHTICTFSNAFLFLIQ